LEARKAAQPTYNTEAGFVSGFFDRDDGMGMAFLFQSMRVYSRFMEDQNYPPETEEQKAMPMSPQRWREKVLEYKKRLEDFEATHKPRQQQ